MPALKAIGREFLGLFVADARFTLALAAWMATADWIIPELLYRARGVGALLLFAGFAVVLNENLIHIASSREPSAQSKSRQN